MILRIPFWNWFLCSSVCSSAVRWQPAHAAAALPLIWRYKNNAQVSVLCNPVHRPNFRCPRTGATCKWIWNGKPNYLAKIIPLKWSSGAAAFRIDFELKTNPGTSAWLLSGCHRRAFVCDRDSLAHRQFWVVRPKSSLSSLSSDWKVALASVSSKIIWNAACFCMGITRRSWGAQVTVKESEGSQRRSRERKFFHSEFFH